MYFGWLIEIDSYQRWRYDGRSFSFCGVRELDVDM